MGVYGFAWGFGLADNVHGGLAGTVEAQPPATAVSDRETKAGISLWRRADYLRYGPVKRSCEEVRLQMVPDLIPIPTWRVVLWSQK
jgi:hypothetical protein